MVILSVYSALCKPHMMLSKISINQSAIEIIMYHLLQTPDTQCIYYLSFSTIVPCVVVVVAVVAVVAVVVVVVASVLIFWSVAVIISEVCCSC